MALQVRLADGYTEDVFENYDGCPRCQYPAGEFNKFDLQTCAKCDSGYHRADMEQYMPDAIENSDGSLTIRRYKTVIGSYPAGRWLTWRRS